MPLYLSAEAKSAAAAPIADDSSSEDSDALGRLLNAANNKNTNSNPISESTNLASFQDSGVGNLGTFSSTTSDCFVDEDLLEDLYKIASSTPSNTETTTPPPDALDVFSQLLNDSLQQQQQQQQEQEEEVSASSQENMNSKFNYDSGVVMPPNNLSALINAQAQLGGPVYQIPATVTPPVAGLLFPQAQGVVLTQQPPQQGLSAPQQPAPLLPPSTPMNSAMMVLQLLNQQAALTTALPANLVLPLDTTSKFSNLADLQSTTQKSVSQDNFSPAVPLNPSSTSSIKIAPASAPGVQKPKKESAISSTDPPLRALSAYNYFFLCERERILNNGGGGGGGAAANNNDEEDWSIQRQEQLLRLHWERDRTVKRRHRKSHGKITFANLSKQISQAWKRLPEHRKDFYRQVAAKDWERYRRALTQHKIDKTLAAMVVAQAPPEDTMTTTTTKKKGNDDATVFQSVVG